MAKRLVEMVNMMLQRSCESMDLDGAAAADIADDLIATGNDPSQVELAMQIADRLKDRYSVLPVNPGFLKSNRIFEQMEYLFLPVDVRGYLHQLVVMEELDLQQREEIVEKLLLCDPAEIAIEDVDYYVREMQRTVEQELGYLVVDPGADYLH